MGMLSNAVMLLSNDTSAIHIAAAVGTKTICITKGVHFGRFVPYPHELFSGLRCVCPTDMNARLHDFDLLCEENRYFSRYDINTVTVEAVKDAIVEMSAA